MNTPLFMLIAIALLIVLFCFTSPGCGVTIKDVAKYLNAKIINSDGNPLLRAKDKYIEVIRPHSVAPDYGPSIHDKRTVSFYGMENLYVCYLFGAGLRGGSINKDIETKNDLIMMIPPRIIKKYNGVLPMPDILYEEERLKVKEIPSGCDEETKFARWRSIVFSTVLLLCAVIYFIHIIMFRSN